MARAARRGLPRNSRQPAVAVAELLWTSLALVLVLEGLLPLVAPRVWRDAFRRLIELSDGQLRFVGLAAVGAGIIALLVLQNA
jgi:uncharacterized protein YjeT (DUF2065 family)